MESISLRKTCVLLLLCKRQIIYSACFRKDIRSTTQYASLENPFEYVCLKDLHFRVRVASLYSFGFRHLVITTVNRFALYTTIRNTIGFFFSSSLGMFSPFVGLKISRKEKQCNRFFFSS